MSKIYSIKAIKVLSVLLGILFSTVANSTLVSFNVDAKSNSSSGSGVGLNTGLSFNNGDVITGSVDANDLWSAGALPRWSNADGLVTDLFATGTDDSGEAAGTKIGQLWPDWTQHGLSLPYGSLVGEINNSFFFLGTNFNLNAPDSGTLFLYYWDENSFDNTGSITVSIENGVSAVPAPSIVWLLGSGLIGLIGMRMKAAKLSENHT